MPSRSTHHNGVFLNNDGKFTFKPLPDEAQLSPAFDICVADFDGTSLDLSSHRMISVYRPVIHATTAAAACC